MYAEERAAAAAAMSTHVVGMPVAADPVDEAVLRAFQRGAHRHVEKSLLAAGAAGGVLSAATHTIKAGSRLLINTSPEPVTNWTASVTEDITVFGGLWLALSHPAVFIGVLVVFILLAIWLIPKLWRAIRFLFKKIAKMFGKETADEPPLEGVRVTLGRKSIEG